MKKLIAVMLILGTAAWVNAEVIETTVGVNEAVTLTHSQPTVIATIYLGLGERGRGLWSVSGLVDYFVQSGVSNVSYVASKIGVDNVHMSLDGHTPIDSTTVRFTGQTLGAYDIHVTHEHTPVYLIAYLESSQYPPFPRAVAWGYISAKSED